MQQHTLTIASRKETGRGVARRLRAAGKIPASLYGQGNARSITVLEADFRELNRKIGGGAALVELTDENGESALCLVQEIQNHAYKRRIDHIDFQEVERGHAFKTRVPVHLVGEADCLGVKNESGVLDQKLHEIDIRCRPSKLPDSIEADVSSLAVGETIQISDLPAVDGVEYLGDPSLVIVSVQQPTVFVETTETVDEIAADEVSATEVSGDSSEEPQEVSKEDSETT